MSWEGVSMFKRILIVAALALAACSPAQTPAAESAEAAADAATAAALPDPGPVIEALYAPYIAGRGHDALPPFSASLSALAEQAERAHDADPANGGMPFFNFDPFIQGQDFEIASVAVTVDQPPADNRAVVTARFRNLRTDVAVTYDLVFENGQWAIDNLRSDDFDMRAFLS
jgi:hypothetical protein